MIYRQELKYAISGAERELLIRRLGAVFARDPYSMPDGTYSVRTLYFDDLYGSALQETLSGAPVREKYRLRMYNLDPSFLRLERKTKVYGGALKPELRMSPGEARRLLSGDAAFFENREEPFAQVCLAEARAGGLKPRTVVDYTRVAFCDVSGNIRITLDSDIRVSPRTDAFFEKTLSGLPAAEHGECVLEVKYNGYLPDYIPQLLGSAGRVRVAYSKFAASGIYY